MIEPLHSLVLACQRSSLCEVDQGSSWRWLLCHLLALELDGIVLQTYDFDFSMNSWFSVVRGDGLLFHAEEEFDSDLELLCLELEPLRIELLRMRGA